MIFIISEDCTNDHELKTFQKHGQLNFIYQIKEV